MAVAVRHRFVGVPGGDCMEVLPDGRGACRQPMVSEYHWSDRRHPFTPGTRGCTWILQQEEAVLGMECGGPAEADWHTCAAVEEARGLAEGNVYQLRPPDEAEEARMAEETVTVEDAREALDGVWAFDDRALQAGPVIPVYDRTLGAEWRAGRPVGVGPWPVRQWVVAAEALGWPEEVEVVLGSLWSVGEAFDTYVWWADGARVVRVVWGSWLGADAETIADWLDGWE